MKEGSKTDRIDARKLSELFHAGMLRAVYHGENGVRTLRELARVYQTVSKDLTRVKRPSCQLTKSRLALSLRRPSAGVPRDSLPLLSIQ